MTAPRQRAVVSTAYTFLAFALPISMLGVMWEDVRLRFDQSVGTLGFAALCYGIGRLSTATTGRHLVARLGTPVAFATMLAALSAAIVTLAVTPSWPLFLFALAAIGACSGSIDSIGAAFIARIEDVASAGLIHGSYGVGATIGPLIVAVSPHWRVAVGLGAVATVSAAAVARSTQAGWGEQTALQPSATATVSGPTPSTSPPVLVIIISLLLFGTFVALEVTSGQWLHTFLTNHRGISGDRASVGVAGFWLGLTLGRLALSRAWASRLVHRVGLPAASAVGTSVFALLIVVDHALAIALPTIAGLAFAPVIPTLFARTAARIGAEHSARIAGWQLIATNLGAIAVPLAVGQLVDRRSAAVIPWVMLAVAVVGTALLLVINAIAPVRSGDLSTSDDPLVT